MARGFNKVILMGNLTRDPEIRYTTANKAYARFTVAVGRSWKDRDGNVQDQTDFIPVVVWGPQAEVCEKYLRKGRPVLIEGRMQVRDYEKDGEKRYVTEVVSQGVTFLGGKSDGGSESGDRDLGGMGRAAQAAKGELDISDVPEDEADIPF